MLAPASLLRAVFPPWFPVSQGSHTGVSVAVLELQLIASSVPPLGIILPFAGVVVGVGGVASGPFDLILQSLIHGFDVFDLGLCILKSDL